VAAALALLAAGAALADTRAPWPTDWNNWNDPALWVTVGNTGNTGELSGAPGRPDRICGAVEYNYRIGKFEVTAGQYTAFLNAVAATDTYGLYNSSMADPYTDYTWGCNIQRTDTGSAYTYSVAADWANRPVNYVSWGDAARFANWLTNGQPRGAQDQGTTEDGSYYLNGATDGHALGAVVRKSPEDGGRYYIPTEDEWYKAAYHKNDGDTGNYFDYPTGTDSVPSHDLIDPDPGNNANFTQEGYTTIGSPYYRTPVGEFENSESPYGTFDQGGNVWEWNEAIIYGGHGQDGRGLRGGSFLVSDGVGDLRAGTRYDTNAGSEYCSGGFRVSEVPEPATMALLALGGATALRRGRRRSPCQSA
jgi:formylglycine-generating enzyme required for sulfatase activity